MTFLNPFAFAYLILLPLLFLLYLLRRPRARYRVSNAYLWPPATPTQSRFALRRIRKNWLLLLQIAFILMLVGALARPTLSWRVESGRHLVFVVDASASMTAREGTSTRFELARARALRMVDRLGSGDQVRLIAARAEPFVVSDFGAGNTRLRRAIERLSPTHVAAGVEEAVTLALSSLAEHQDAEVYVFTDEAGAARRPAEGALPSRVHYLPVGRAADNMAITRFEARPHPASPFDAQVYVEVANFSRTHQSTGLVLAKGGTAVRRDTIRLDPGERKGLVEPLRTARDLVTATLETNDALDVDNRAYTFAGAPERIEVLLVSDGNPFLEKALEVNPLVATWTMRVRDYAANPPARRYDVVVCDGCRDASAVDTNLLHVQAPDHNSSGGGRIEVADPDHPIMSFVDLADLVVDHVAAVRVRPGARVLARVSEQPILTAAERRGRRIVEVGLDLRASRVPLSVSFPILVSNAVMWLSGAEDGNPAIVRTGAAVRWRLDPALDLTEVTVTDPAGVSRRHRVIDGLVHLPRVEHAGVYRVSGDRYGGQFAANLLSEAESDIGSAARPAASTPGTDRESAGTPVPAGSAEIWRLLMIVALLLLALEWLCDRRAWLRV